MKYLIIISLVFIVIVSCGSIKQDKEALRVTKMQDDYEYLFKKLEHSCDRRYGSLEIEYKLLDASHLNYFYINGDWELLGVADSGFHSTTHVYYFKRGSWKN